MSQLQMKEKLCAWKCYYDDNLNWQLFFAVDDCYGKILKNYDNNVGKCKCVNSWTMGEKMPTICRIEPCNWRFVWLKGKSSLSSPILKNFTILHWGSKCGIIVSLTTIGECFFNAMRWTFTSIWVTWFFVFSIGPVDFLN